MAAPVHTTQARKSHWTVSETAIKKDFLEMGGLCALFSIAHLIPRAKNLFVLGKANTQTRQNFKIARDVEPPPLGERGALRRARKRPECAAKLGANAMGGLAGRPRIGFQKTD